MWQPFISVCVYDEGVIPVFALEGKIWSRPPVHRQPRKKNSTTAKQWKVRKHIPNVRMKSTQFYHFLLNIDLTSCAFLFFRGCVGFPIFFRDSIYFLKKENKQTTTKIILEVDSKREFDKTQGPGSLVTRINWSRCVRSVSEGWIKHLRWVWELQW